MVTEPLPKATFSGLTKAATNNRWRPWYSSIADVMLRNPNATIAEIAKELGRGTATVGMVMASDTFRDYFARRRAEFSERHDFAIIAGLQEIAVASIGELSRRLKGPEAARIPARELRETATSVLDRLGYAPDSKPAVAVNVSGNEANVVVVPAASRETLENARSVLRAVEAQRAAAPLAPLVTQRPASLESPKPEGGALQVLDLRPEPESGGEGDDPTVLSD